MGTIRTLADIHGQQLQLRQARQLFFDQGEALPAELVDPVVARSWERCRRFGLEESGLYDPCSSLDRLALKTEQERNRCLINISRPIMDHVYDQIRDSGSMVILADAGGLLLETVGDAEFVDRARRVALSPGASWDENNVGTNAVGTVLAEEKATAIVGAEHFLDQNNFLTCFASPIFGPDGRLLGVLDISGDYRSYQHHTLGLVRLSSSIVEKRIFETAHERDILVCFHENPSYVGSPQEGMVAVTPDGQIMAINRNGIGQLGIRPFDALRRDFSIVFENSLSGLVDRVRQNPKGLSQIKVGGKQLFVQLRGHLPTAPVASSLYEEAPAPRAPRRPEAPAKPNLTLDNMNTGDLRLQAALDRARRILGKDIPMLIQGESGAGKEMFAKSFHNSGPRRDAPFVALNCASIPESLIESELFGYQGGAFTGARKEGAPGKIQQAHGGTLFLDEIGDMPLNLQARLLRVLQERCVTPLGSTRAIQVDISLVCATHRKLRDEVARGTFREDLYYRLNGLAVTLPPLRERTDIRVLVGKLVAAEAANRPTPVRFSECALQAIENYSWPGNIRQLFNVIRVAIALLDDDETLITESLLPEELFETPIPSAAPIPAPSGHNPWAAMPLEGVPGSLEEINRQVAQRALDEAGGQHFSRRPSVGHQPQYALSQAGANLIKALGRRRCPSLFQAPPAAPPTRYSLGRAPVHFLNAR